MEDLKPVIAKNITELRKAKNLTQAELAGLLNYSDKAVSKWERGESVPDVAILKELAGIFGVTMDYLLEKEHPKPPPSPAPEAHAQRNRRVITLMSVTLVFLLATLLFVVLGIVFGSLHQLWLLYVYAVPIASIVALVFNSLWGKRRSLTNCLIVSLLVWSLLGALYLTFIPLNLWLLFVLGIPAQVLILLWSRLKFRK